MPIVFIHGVRTRHNDLTKAYEGPPYLKALLKQFVAPAISNQPDEVPFFPIYWGDLGVEFFWNNASCPVSPLLKMGSSDNPARERVIEMMELPNQTLLEPTPSKSSDAGLIAMGPQRTVQRDMLSPNELDSDSLADLLLSAMEPIITHGDLSWNDAIDAVIQVTNDTHFRQNLKGTPDPETALNQLCAQLNSVGTPFMRQGHWPAWLQATHLQLQHALRRTTSLPGYVLSRGLIELRRPLHTEVAAFLGDVLTYIRNRGDASAPGPIPCRALEHLHKAAIERELRQEPLVVISHSMGGQIIYDIVSHFLPNRSVDYPIYIDFWCATASQVGFFEETKHHIDSSPQYRTGTPVPFPYTHVKHWWNVWDPNDILSFTATGIIEGVYDEYIDTGHSLLGAHDGYLKSIRFFRKFNERLVAAFPNKSLA